MRCEPLILGRQALQLTSLVWEMIIFVTQQFSHTFWTGGIIGLVMDNTPVTWRNLKLYYRINKTGNEIENDKTSDTYNVWPFLVQAE
jgi:hypothetical protein